MNAGISDAVDAAGGAIFAVTSEPQTLADDARASWDLDFPVVGDPHHEIVETCRERGWVSLFVNPNTRLLLADSPWAAHPNGYLQPGVLAVTREGRVLYRWRGRPTRQNIGGATNRPLPEDVWQKIQREQLAAGGGDAALDEPENVDQKGGPWPLFVMMLLANGWFVRPRTFGLAHRGPNDTRKRLRRAQVRLVSFVAAWLIAFALLPFVPVAVALLAWIAWVTPRVRELTREFQSVPTGEPAVP